MTQMTERTAAELTSGQATELVQILDLQARWENHRHESSADAGTAADLRARQRAHDQFQAAWQAYTIKHRASDYPQATQSVPDRLAAWCRVLRVVFRLAEGGSPSRVMAKVYRLADRIAKRVDVGPVAHAVVNDLAKAARELDVVIAWCDALSALVQAEAA